MRRTLALGTLALVLVSASPAAASHKSKGGSSKPAPTPSPSPAPVVVGPSVLILHDTAGDFGVMGAEYALMVRNLLGHFKAVVETKPVTTYAAGDMAEHDATFYIGTTYEEPSHYDENSPEREAYRSFLADAARHEDRLAWLGFNIWKLAWEWDPVWGPEGFAARFGFSFWGYDLTSAYNRVRYKGVDLHKGGVLHELPGALLDGCIPEGGDVHACDPLLGTVGIDNPSLATPRAEAFSTFTSARAPYVTQSGSFWYFGDIPLSYISEEDRYLAFADLLHDILWIPHQVNHRALARLEDVSSRTTETGLRADAAVFARNDVPFSVAVIPMYKDPLNATGGGRVTNGISIAGSEVGQLLQTYKQQGVATMIQHGTTHQYAATPNPFNGLTGDDFEFYRVTQNLDQSLNFVGAVAEDSTSWARDRVISGRTEMERAGLAPALAFEAPHYTASAVDYAAFKSLYPITYGRLQYYVPGVPDRAIGQFFPYETVDVYGNRIIPENLGNIEPIPFPGFPLVFPDELLSHAAKALVVRDGFASFYFHPDYDSAYLDTVVRGIKALGYKFVKPCTVVAAC